MKTAANIAYFRQLCCLGLREEMIIPELLRAVKRIIPSDSNAFVGYNIFRDQNSKITLYPEILVPEYIIPDVLEYAHQEYDQVFPEELQRFTLNYFSTNNILADVYTLNTRFYHSCMYNNIWRPYNQHYNLFGRVTYGDTKLKVINLFRARKEPPFTDNEIALFTQLLPYIAHAVNSNTNSNTIFADSGTSGMLIMTPTGKVMHMDDTGKQLLFLACRDRLAPNGNTASISTDAPPVLKQLCSNLDAIFQGKDARPPIFYHHNVWGRFTFRAYWLKSVPDFDVGGLIGVTITLHEPVNIQAMRNMRTLPLSPVQRNICLLLLQNNTQEEISRKLNIKITTVKDYLRKAYEKLDINGREDLLALITANSIQY